MNDQHPSSFSEWTLRLMAIAGLCLLVTMSVKLIKNVTRVNEPARQSAQR